jgi:hypothetical protein
MLSWPRQPTGLQASRATRAASCQVILGQEIVAVSAFQDTAKKSKSAMRWLKFF